jgi:CRP-like cAMP-binding protein
MNGDQHRHESEETMNTESLFQHLATHELDRIRSHGVRRALQAGEHIFSEGDVADYIYFIESGRISIFIEKFNSPQEIHTLGPSEWFGEMAVFFKDKRTACASAVEDSVLLSIPKADFLALMRSERTLADKINAMLAKRNEELVLKEKLINTMGVAGRHLHIGIKGDPSLRESALTRERYQSVVDQVLPELIPHLEELLLRRSVYQIFIGFNSGEIRVCSIMDPFSEEFHPAKRLLDPGYLDRHFPRIDYDSKAEIIRSVYRTMQVSPFFSTLPPALRSIFQDFYHCWEPVSPEDISRTISHLPVLRSIQNYYVRNATISIIKDAIHMQFNCDGAHIVSSEDYERFLEENL